MNSKTFINSSNKQQNKNHPIKIQHNIKRNHTCSFCKLNKSFISQKKTKEREIYSIRKKALSSTKALTLNFKEILHIINDSKSRKEITRSLNKLRKEKQTQRKIQEIQEADANIKLNQNIQNRLMKAKSNFDLS